MKYCNRLVISVLFFAILITSCNQNSEIAIPKASVVVMEGGNLQRSGVYEFNGIKPIGELNWQFEIDTGESQRSKPIYSSPAISNGYAYFGDSSGLFYAVEISTGREKWRFNTVGAVNPKATSTNETAISSSPTVHNGAVYFGSLDNFFYAVDAKTGNEIWKYEAEDMIISSPLVSDGYVYFGSYDGYLYSLNIETGEAKWKFKTLGAEIPKDTKIASPKHIEIGAISDSPALADNIIYFGCWDGYFYAVNTQTGNLVWNFKTLEGQPVGATIISDDLAYFFNADFLYAVDTKNGIEEWRLPRNLLSYRMAISDGVMYLGYDDRLHAVDSKTGQELWKVQISDSVQNPSISGKVVYIESSNYLFAVNSADGSNNWKYKLDAEITTDIVISDGLIFFGDANGVLNSLK